MLRHSLLLALRNIKKYISSFLINMIGLSTGLCCVLLIFLWVNDELKVDKFHEKDDRSIKSCGTTPWAMKLSQTQGTLNS